MFKGQKKPDFDVLLTDMRAGKFDAIAVYKLERIGRSLQHLLQLFEEFKKKNVMFISVTQNFDTVTPEGRLMLHMMMLLAEYEREMISCRTKDTLDRYQHQIDEQGFFITTAGKKKTKLGRPKGSKDKNSDGRPKSGYYRGWLKRQGKL